MAAAKYKLASTNHITDDLVFSILSKLPLKSLKRFTCVKKSFSRLFQNLDFMSMFRTSYISKHNESNENTCLILVERTQRNPFPYALCKFSGEKFEHRDQLDLPPPFHEGGSCIKILGFSSVNGTLCLYKGSYHDTTTVLWNPATAEFKVVPPSPQPYDNIEFNGPPLAFGYDHVRHDFKLIRIAYYPSDFKGNWVYVPKKDSSFRNMYDDHTFWETQVVDMYDPFWEIYSLKSNSWRKLDEIDMHVFWQDGYPLSLNEFCHWLGSNDDIVSFDFSNEIFFATNLPSLGYNNDFSFATTSSLPFKHKPRFNVEKYLVGIHGSVALISTIITTGCFDIWILGELGVKESWTKLFVIGHGPSTMRPFGMGIKNLIFIVKEDEDIAWYDLSNQRIEEIGVKGDSICFQIIVYEENLLSFQGINI